MSATDSAAYLDASAFVKLVVIENETEALVAHLRQYQRRISSILLHVEAVRAVRREAPSQVNVTFRALDGLALVPVDDGIIRDAGALDDDRLRSLDAIHLATAKALGDDLAELITYDRRMADAARDLGLPVAAPA